jgi:hypothetical protein
MTAPKKTLQFSIRTKQRVDVAPAIFKKKYKQAFVSPTTSELTRFSGKPFRYSEEEIDWMNHQEVQLTEVPREDPSWLRDRLKGDTQCGWCSNTLTLEFNSTRSGFQIACSYCGMAGPCESEATAAIDAFNQTSTVL